MLFHPIMNCSLINFTHTSRWNTVKVYWLNNLHILVHYYTTLHCYKLTIYNNKGQQHHHNNNNIQSCQICCAKQSSFISTPYLLYTGTVCINVSVEQVYHGLNNLEQGINNNESGVNNIGNLTHHTAVHNHQHYRGNTRNEHTLTYIYIVQLCEPV